jgi:hypothetical protein
MTQNPYSPQNQQPPSPQPSQPFAGQPMNIYPAPGIYGVYPGQQAKGPAWPTAVGIISLCLAGLFGLMTIGGLIIATIAAKFQPSQNNDLMANMPAWFEMYQWFANALAIATYAVLAVGGVMLLKRRRAGRTLHIVYVVLEVIVAICGLVVMIAVMQHTSAAATMPSKTQVVFAPEPMMAVIAIFSLAYTMAYPTFILIWFSRKKVIEHIRTWTR